MFTKAFEKTAVSREWINNHIHGGMSTRASKLTNELKKHPKEVGEKVHKGIEDRLGAMLNREKTLSSPKTGDREFRAAVHKQIADIKDTHKIPGAAKSKKGKYLAMGAGALGAASIAGYVAHKHRKRQEDEKDQASLSA